MTNSQPQSFFASIGDRHAIITAINSGIRFPEVVSIMVGRYEDAIRHFATLVQASASSGDLLGQIRTPQIPGERRMALLKIFRRCVSGVCDTEATKKINTVSTASLVSNYGYTFKSIKLLQNQFLNLSNEFIAALAVSIGEYDNRGQQGYALTGQLFDWFEQLYGTQLMISGPRGAGPDIELRDIVPDFPGSCPCDFVIQSRTGQTLLAVGFARYDSTRGGAQSDDRTGGNTAKVYAIRSHLVSIKKSLRIVFLADGPGLTHNDTWREAIELDGMWDGNVRVTTLKLAPQRITLDWLDSVRLLER